MTTMLWVAERMALLDHPARGRTMLGVGPGSLPTDSAMIGLNPTDTRELIEENPDIVMRLPQLRPYSDPLFDVAVAAVASPTGPRLAGRNEVGIGAIGTPDDAAAQVQKLVDQSGGSGRC